jgi:branched-chain amino acid aminotransferase
MVEESKYIWMDGEFVPWNEAKVHILTHTLHYGLGAFEGIRCYKTPKGSAIFRLHEHNTRFFNSALIAGVKLPYSKEEIAQACIETIRINELEECYIRPLWHIGFGEMGINFKNNPIHISIAVWPWGAYLGDEGLQNGIRLKVSSITRHHVNISMTKAKICGNYANSQLAKAEALDLGYDEALMLDEAGYVAECTGENVFIVRDDLIKTPPLTSILEGITRDSVMKIAMDQGMRVREELFTRDHLYTSDEAFLTGTAAELTPIKEVDNRLVGEGKPGPTTKELQKLFFEVVQGEYPKFKGWLTYI